MSQNKKELDKNENSISIMLKKKALMRIDRHHNRHQITQLHNGCIGKRNNILVIRFYQLKLIVSQNIYSNDI